MTKLLLETYKQGIAEMTLIPSKGGCFEVDVNGELIYSKLETGEFPSERTIVDQVGQR